MIEMKKPKKENFSFDKVKLLKDGGLDVKFDTEEAEKNEVYRDKNHIESSRDVHPDLREKFDELKIIVARVFHLTFFSVLVENKFFNADKGQKKIAQKMEDELLKKIDVTGISLSGSDKNKGVVITATITADTNQKMAINTHRMNFSGTKYGFEEQLEQIVDEIRGKVYEFLFNNKRQQLELFDQPEEDGKAAAAGGESREIDQEEE